MLDKELWGKLPAELPSLAAALRGRPSSGDERGGGSSGSSPASSPAVAAQLGAEGRHGAGDGGSSGGEHPLAAFERWVVQGNPWRKQGSPRRRRQQQLGFGGSAGAAAALPRRQATLAAHAVRCRPSLLRVLGGSA
jgi:hypothetical protein